MDSTFSEKNNHSLTVNPKHNQIMNWSNNSKYWFYIPKQNVPAIVDREDLFWQDLFGYYLIKNWDNPINGLAGVAHTKHSIKPSIDERVAR